MVTWYENLDDWALILELRLTEAEIDLRTRLQPSSKEKKVIITALHALRTQIRSELDER